VTFVLFVVKNCLTTKDAKYTKEEIQKTPQRAKLNQFAVSSLQRAAIGTTDYKKASSKKPTPPPGLSKFRFAYCLLLSAY